MPITAAVKVNTLELYSTTNCAIAIVAVVLIVIGTSTVDPDVPPKFVGMLIVVTPVGGTLLPLNFDREPPRI